MLRERRIYQLQKKRKEDVALWLLAVGALFLTFNPLNFKDSISLGSSDISDSTLLVTNFIDQENIEEPILTGIGGIDSKSPELITTTYNIQKGESLLDIAKREGLHIDTLLSANQINNANSIFSGQEIKIPNQEGVYHKIESGQTISQIAKAYKIDTSKILKFNNINDPEKIRQGEKIFIPGARILQTNRKYLLDNLKVERGFTKPVFMGWFSSGFGYRKDPFNENVAYHSGIDIAAYYGTPIRASKSGKIIFSGWGKGYGNLIIIRHDNRYKTYYGHMSKRIVENGQWVNQGQIIGLVGNTGRSLGSHLHFEIRDYSRPIDPSKHVQFSRRLWS